MDQTSALLRRAMPFQMVSDEMLHDIAKLAKSRSYARGDMIYDVGDEADDIHIVASGSVQHTLHAGADAADAAGVEKVMRSGDVFGWAAVLEGQRGRLAKTVCLERTELVQINGEDLMSLIRRSPATGDVIMSRFATLITKEFSAPDSVAARLPHLTNLTAVAQPAAVQGAGVASGWALTRFRIAQWIKSPKPYLMLGGFAILLGLWYLTVEAWRLPRFRDIPGPTTVFKEMFNSNPTYGLSVYTPDYYQHIWVSVRRVAIAFALATGLGVPLGLFLGWSKVFREYVFPVFETLRPIPILAWVPLAILMFTGTETPVIFLTFLASFLPLR